MGNKIKAALRRNEDRARARREIQMLLGLDDHVLRDIGVRRDEIHARLAGF
jgi:uncharacterized protein YjiS (DUF1127 family)